MFCAPLIETFHQLQSYGNFSVQQELAQILISLRYIRNFWCIPEEYCYLDIKGIYECRLFSVYLIRMRNHDINSSERSTVKSVQVTTT